MRLVLAPEIVVVGGVIGGSPATAQVAKSYQFCSKEVQAARNASTTTSRSACKTLEITAAGAKPAL